ncbi:glycine--tRNA ligase subunit beta [Haematospirillum jordaniae]|uniref:Glycine--tRNA ligase beta subunit n=1 Tax=Haematospirillum jordaniae TaxID=1549855 RepID=A0A143DGI1_9PROT|nr:glycine--tRNA ligase subunit beta [Haematospirillum jordaniae]AMW35689.1 glycine--tRNA ligase subunit beta [Haematospirillum jordaniae]NKD45548.1 glycine--tRNA ligase subunit beta [Haematospirillum jordaniae]NKD56156.1 glycine--tRNA ligase subunit beta [Haematospirillum jordaniae]NKD58214.1 glycine--tRNA ligase subunit beta [Haematospirillum jordaniae]NKD66615.1 glycine--tRNA ligase subunit beta [Haematospirillum jordaniae]
MAQSLLLELLSEEIPARMQAAAAEALERLVCDGLQKAGFSAPETRTYVTPRRLTLVIDGLPEATPDVSEERRGPRVDAPEKAIQGFLAANGVTLDQCEKRETPKGTFLFSVVCSRGRPMSSVLKEAIEGALASFPWPKSMRWGTGPQRWVRPLHSILCLFGSEVVPVSFAGLVAGNVTRGHRFHAPAVFSVTGPADYLEKLAAAKVVLDPVRRSALIEAAATALANRHGVRLKEDAALLREVTGLVEWPVVLSGAIEDVFMDLPAEVLTTSMRAHQKYFSTVQDNGSLAPRFVVVSNMETEDGGQQIVSGNERVLRARLSDARFFWDQDRKVRLEARVDTLRERIFHARLGTEWEKVARIRTLAAMIAGYMGADSALVDRAALLAKADLSTGMVGEFPELQGVMGRYYARADGEPDAVADAVAEHYSPQGPSDRCPSAPVSVCIALSDKIDTLAGFWSIDEKPTGSKDPFALRRAALGVIRLVLENGLRLPLRAVFLKALDAYSVPRAASSDVLATDLMAFFAERLKVFLREKGLRHDLVSAVLSLGHEDDLVRLVKRVEALSGLLRSDDGANLLAAWRRAMNIVRIEDRKDGPHTGPVDVQSLVMDEEKALAAALSATEPGIHQALDAEDYQQVAALVAGLRGPVDAFFENVTVNDSDPDLRRNRLRLLSAVGAVTVGLADLALVEGSGPVAEAVV